MDLKIVKTEWKRGVKEARIGWIGINVARN